MQNQKKKIVDNFIIYFVFDIYFFTKLNIMIFVVEHQLFVNQFH